MYFIGKVKNDVMGMTIRDKKDDDGMMIVGVVVLVKDGFKYDDDDPVALAAIALVMFYQ